MEEDNQPVQTPEEKQEGLILLRDQNKLLEKRIELMEVEKGLLDGMYGTTAERLRFEERIQETRIEQEEILLALAREGDKEAKKRLETLRKQGEQTKTVENLQKKIQETSEKVKNIAKKRTRLEKLKESSMRKVSERAAKELNKLEEAEQEINKLEVELLGIRRASVKVLQDTNRELSDLVRRIPGYDAFEGLTDFMKVMRGDGLGAAITTLLPKGINALIGAFNFAKDAYLDVDQASVDLTRAVGPGGLGSAISFTTKQMSTNISTMKRLSRAGVEMKDVFKAAGELFGPNAAFGIYSQNISKSADFLESLVIQQKLFGVTSEQQANLLGNAYFDMGLSISKAEEFVRGFEEQAQLAGMSTPQMITNFVAEYPKLRIYGKKAEGIFRSLNKDLRDQGLGFGFIENLMNQFSTYESSAKNVVKLNMLLGTKFNPLKMLSLDPEEMFNEFRSQMKGKDLKKIVGNNFRLGETIAKTFNVSYNDLLRALKEGKVPSRKATPTEAALDKLVSINELISAATQNTAFYTGAMAKDAIGKMFSLTGENVFTGKQRAERYTETDFGLIVDPNVAEERLVDLPQSKMRQRRDTLDILQALVRTRQEELSSTERALVNKILSNSFDSAAYSVVDDKSGEQMKQLLQEISKINTAKGTENIVASLERVIDRLGSLEVTLRR